MGIFLKVGTTKKEEVDFVGRLDPSTGVYSQNTTSENIVVTTVTSTVTATPTLATTRPRTMDIFSTAIASANINLDNFMEEEDGKYCKKLTALPPSPIVFE